MGGQGGAAFVPRLSSPGPVSSWAISKGGHFPYIVPVEYKLISYTYTYLPIPYAYFTYTYLPIPIPIPIPIYLYLFTYTYLPIPIPIPLAGCKNPPRPIYMSAPHAYLSFMGKM